VTYQPPSAKREVPDYDGRGEEPARAADVAMLSLRVVLSPLYLVSELIRQPIGALMIAAERANLPRKAYELFVFGPDHKAGIIPVGFVAFALNPSVGAYGFWNDAFSISGNALRVHVEAWPNEWIGASASDRWRFNEGGDSVQLRTKLVRRPDNPFYGIGPRSREADQSRYMATRFDTDLSLEVHWWRSSRIAIAPGMRAMEIGAGHYSDDPSVDEQANMGVFPLPFGFGRSYAGPTGRVYASFDTREDTSASSGVRLETHAYTGSDVSHAMRSAWLRYGAVASGAVDLDGYGRNLELSVAALFADPLTSEPIPFTELVTLGGQVWMPGYLPGRLIDRSAAVASLRYAWPIALYIDATLQGAVGNVFGPHLEGITPGLFRFSGGIGLRTRTDPPLELVIGFGTDTFDNGATVQSGRISFGVPQSF